MNCHIIFYMAKKTNLCEKTLKNALGDIEINTEKVIFATSPESLGQSIITSLTKCNLIFTVGGLFSSDDSGIENVLSNALSPNPPSEVKKLRSNAEGNDGYFIRKGCQAMVVLPDEPESIADIFSSNVKDFLKEYINFNQ